MEALLTDEEKTVPRVHAEKEVICRLAANQWEYQRFRCIRLIVLEDKCQTVEVRLQHEALPAGAGAFAIASTPFDRPPAHFNSAPNPEVV